MMRFIHVALLIFMIQPAFPQVSFQAIMDSVMANYKTLSASRQYSETQKLSARTGIHLANPSVSFDKLSNSSGNYSEMVISQSFDFPMAYVHKSKIAGLLSSQADEQFRQAKLEVMIAVAEVYAQLIYTNRKISIFSKRHEMGMQLQAGIEKRLNAGDVNIFEVNRAKSELAKTQSELKLAESFQKSLHLKLKELNGGQSIVVKDTTFQVLAGFSISDASASTISARNPQVKQWEAESQMAERNISLQRSLSLPKFEIGYRQDINTGQTFSGFHAGVTIPLFENKNTVKSAKARQLYTTESANAYRLELQSNISRLIEEYNATQQSVTSINEVFSTLNTPELLMKAYKAGQINYTEFFLEYENYQQTALYIEELNQKSASLQLQLYVLSGF